MADYSALKATIDNTVNTNGTQAITGAILNTTLKAMVDALGDGYKFMGVATISTNPQTPDGNVFYLAEAGNYPNFGNITINENCLGLLLWDGTSWTKEEIEGLGGGGATLTGYVSVASINDLPSVGEATLGYLVGQNLYLYVGTGGDTLDGKYKNCGPFRGPQGQNGAPGATGQNGKSAYQIWLEQGNVGTEADFIASLQGNSGYTGAAGELEVVNNLIDGGATKALSAQMGVTLKGLIDTIPEHALITEDGIIFCDSYLNVGAKLDSEGFTAINSLEIIKL